jgi:hypothetical protein
VSAPLGKAGCAGCAHFKDQPQALEAALPGLASLSSGYAAVRDADGLCAVHDRYVSARSHCPRFSARRQAA